MVVGVIGYYVVIDFVYSYHTQFFTYKACAWIFADSAKKGIDTLFAGSSLRNSDQIYTYVYNHDYYVSIWEIKALRDVDLKKIIINQSVYLSHVELYPGETLDKGSGLETDVKFGPFFKDKIAIDLDEYSKIYKTFEKDNFKGFYGSVSRMAFENGDGQILAMKDYPLGMMQTLFVLYKANNSFYMITINSRKQIDESTINILNLK